jgi:hypothetical protein
MKSNGFSAKVVRTNDAGPAASVDNLIESRACQGTIGRSFTFAMEEVRAFRPRSVRPARLVRSKAAVNLASGSGAKREGPVDVSRFVAAVPAGPSPEGRLSTFLFTARATTRQSSPKSGITSAISIRVPLAAASGFVVAEVA